MNHSLVICCFQVAAVWPPTVLLSPDGTEGTWTPFQSPGADPPWSMALGTSHLRELLCTPAQGASHQERQNGAKEQAWGGRETLGSVN